MGKVSESSIIACDHDPHYAPVPGLDMPQPEGYNAEIERLRPIEYPQLEDCTYLDHASTTVYSKSAIEAFSKDLCNNLYGNPHSPSPSSQLSTERVENIRLRVLQHLKADPELFDVVFCANATAGIKLVAEGFSAQAQGFRYIYHGDSHTSLVGVRELAKHRECLLSDSDVETWLEQTPNDGVIGLFGWPAQSNFSGRRLPLQWAARLRNLRARCFSLLDAAALLTTAPLDLSDAVAAPDFIVFSFYKMFGFPDLGALVVRRDSSDILRQRKYFGGGTVDSLTATKTDFVARKSDDPHSYLEDGTIPFHSIIALDAAMSAYKRIHKYPEDASKHAFSLGRRAYQLLSGMRHFNGRRLCTLYGQPFESPAAQGPIVTFNMQHANGDWIGYAEVEKLLSIKKVHVRVGGICNPGGVEALIGLSAQEIQGNYAAGHVCSDDHDIMGGKPTGAIRVSFGIMSTMNDIATLVCILDEFYVERGVPEPSLSPTINLKAIGKVDNLTIYPVKSCAGFQIPGTVSWEVTAHGLAWDREWCLVHQGSGMALSLKTYPRMAFIKPRLDLSAGILYIQVHQSSELGTLEIPLWLPPSALAELKPSTSRVCGDKITTMAYDAPHIVRFFSGAVGVPCTLARLPENNSSRNYRPHSRRLSSQNTSMKNTGPKILLSNESPILVISQSSVDELNRCISDGGGKTATAGAFRANIIVKESGTPHPYAEDEWHHIKIGQEFFEVLGPCRRCHMVCIDPSTAIKDEEPYVTLSKTRRIDGRVLFGQHATYIPIDGRVGVPTIKVGDLVRAWRRDDHIPESEDGACPERSELDVICKPNPGVLSSIRSVALGALW